MSGKNRHLFNSFVQHPKYFHMVLKVIELLASSKVSWEEAAKEAVKQAALTLHNIRSVYIKDHSAKVVDNKIVEFRVNAKVTFALDTTTGES
jgi:hypothetical protein